MDIIGKFKKLALNGKITTIKEIQKAEKDLGFELPELLKEIYLKVSNGNKNLPMSIIGLKSGYIEDFGDIVSWHKINISANHEPDMPNWNEKMLAIADLGCCEYICLDCSTKDGYVWKWDGNKFEEEKPETIDDCWIDLNITFHDWIKKEIIELEG